MQQALIEYACKFLEPTPLLCLLNLIVLLNLVMAIRAGLLSHLTRIHSAIQGKDYIRKDTYQIAEECFKRYKNLGGDGYADGIMDDIRKIPRK